MSCGHGHYKASRLRGTAFSLTAAVVSTLLASTNLSAQTTGDHLDPALGGGIETDAASILLDNPSAVVAASRGAGAAAYTEPATQFRAALSDLLPSGASWTQVYVKMGYAPIWLADAAAATGAADLGWDKAEALLDAADAARSHALPVGAYQTVELRAQMAAIRSGGTLEDAAAFEIALTKMFLHLGRDLASGALEPRSIIRNIDVTPHRPQPLILLATATGWDATATRGEIEALAPQTAEYREMRALYGKLKSELDAGGWGAEVPSGPTMSLEARGPRVIALRDRLKAMGYLPFDAPQMVDPQTGEVLFDPLTDIAVRTFQERHGLEVDGVVGAATLAEINKNLDDRLALVAVNLERMRWYNFDLGQRHILVNIAGFEARVIEDGGVLFYTRVVVGKTKHQTPEFSDEMTHVVVNPIWHVPYSIATEEFLPVLQDNPGALTARNIHVFNGSGAYVDPWSVDWWSLSTGFFPYHLKQGPGRGNALGGVKFIFPNKHAVYLHDTPAKSLFERVVRAFSHGCVRVADPTGLAETLLGAQHADPLGYFVALRSQRDEVFVELRKKVPVYLQYRTVWFDENGALQVRDDIYGRDRILYQALQKMGMDA